MDYDKMLDEAWSDMPEDVANEVSRFELPKAKGHHQGNRTVITNFSNLVSAIGRDAQHFLKYLLKEIAAPGTLEAGRLMIGRKVSSALLNSKIKKYVEEFVLCECGKPDTSIITKEGKTYLKCMACGKQREVKL